MPKAGAGTCEVSIIAGNVPESGESVGRQIGPFSHASATELWLHVPGVARFLVSDACKIVYQREPGIDDDSIRLFLLGTCMGTLLLQRGRLVLHGNAFVIDGACIVCVGPSGAGKSTLAARMWQLGHGVLADDVVPIDEAGCAIPGLPRIKIWQDTADALEIDTHGLHRIRPALAKFDMPLKEAFHSELAPTQAVYVLSPWNRGNFSLEELVGAKKFVALHENGYRPRFMHGMGRGAEQLQMAGEFAAKVPVITVHRPRLGFDIDGLADAIRRDVARRRSD